MAKRRLDVAGAASQVLPSGVATLHPEEVVFEAMLSGWSAQQRSRLLSAATVEQRMILVRRFAAFANSYPWQWSAADVEEWTVSLLSGDRPRAHSTLRSYQNAVAMFCDYLTDSRYGWAEQCEARFGAGAHPVQVCHQWNTVHHTAEFEGRPSVRPFTRAELQAFFDHADDRVARVRSLGRKGWLAAFRDAALFKTAYAFGLRRRELVMLDLADLRPNAAAPEFGDYGAVSVRYGKAAKGSPPRRRSVLTVWGWAAQMLAEYTEDIRPLYAGENRATLWPTERGGRVATDYVNIRFAEYRDALGLPAELHPHCLRHSYVTHLIEDGFDPLFVQQQVGHAWGSTTALYTGVSGDYKNRMLRQALDRALAPVSETGGVR